MQKRKISSSHLQITIPEVRLGDIGKRIKHHGINWCNYFYQHFVPSSSAISHSPVWFQQSCRLHKQKKIHRPLDHKSTIKDGYAPLRMYFHISEGLGGKHQTTGNSWEPYPQYNLASNHNAKKCLRLARHHDWWIQQLRSSPSPPYLVATLPSFLHVLYIVNGRIEQDTEFCIKKNATNNLSYHVLLLLYHLYYTSMMCCTTEFCI